MRGNAHARFGERDEGNGQEQSWYRALVPTPRDPTPSPEDAAITREIVKAGELLSIDVVDHIVVGKGKFVSLKERGLGF